MTACPNNQFYFFVKRSACCKVFQQSSAQTVNAVEGLLRQHFFFRESLMTAAKGPASSDQKGPQKLPTDWVLLVLAHFFSVAVRQLQEGPAPDNAFLMFFRKNAFRWCKLLSVNCHPKPIWTSCSQHADQAR